MVINQINQILVQNKLVEADQFCKVTQRQIVFWLPRTKKSLNFRKHQRGAELKGIIFGNVCTTSLR